MLRTRKLLRLAATFTAVSLLVPAVASARKKGPLEGEPAVRKKMELRKLRFQVTPLAAMSLSQAFTHTGYVGARLQFDFLDWLGIRAGFAYGVVAPKAKLLKSIEGGGLQAGFAPGQPDMTAPAGSNIGNDSQSPKRPYSEYENPAPLLHDFQAGLTKPQWYSSADLVFTPFAGKLGLFSAIFTEYDLYFFGGLGIMGWSKFYPNAKSTAELNGLSQNAGDPATHCQFNDATIENECILHPVVADVGVKLGPSFGGGLHLFITDWVSINLELQDIVTRNNLTGLNATVADVPPAVDKRDKNFNHNVTLQLGATFYIPFRAKRSK